MEGGKAPKAGKKTGAKNNALMRPLDISADLEAIVGKGPMARSQIMKKIWDFIKKHDLQDKSDKRMIIPNATFAKVFGGAKISMFHFGKKINAHIKK